MNVHDAHTLRAVFSFVLTLLQLPAMGVFLYFITLSAFAWVRRQEPNAAQFPLKHRFALVVPSHNEQLVISKIVENLKALDYPADLYDIVVIADNCTDATAQAAREAGALVLERFDAVRKGKGYALEWVFPQLFQRTPAYDAVCIFDSDNLVSPNFLKEMNKHLCLGHKVVQGYLDSKNPLDTWISANNSIAFWIGNRMYQLPRSYLGLSNVLGGTGMMIASDVLQSLGWGATCLTEDLEFTAKVVLQGMKVHWAHDAVIYDEKPLGLRQSMRQRVRWMKGQADVISRFFIPLLKRFWTQRDWVALDLAVYILQPVFILVNFFCLIMGLILSAVFPQPVQPQTNTALSQILFLLMLYMNGFFLFLEGRASPAVLGYFLTYPLYNLTWIPVVMVGFWKKNHKEWSHTLHTRVLDLREVPHVRKA